MSPYLSDVVNATQANINESNTEQQQQLQGNAISAGAWGGDRAGVAAAELARQQNLAGQQTIAGLYNTGYGQALSTAQQQQQQQLQQAQAQYAVGTQQQQTSQAGLSAAYQQWLNQQQYPFASTEYLANIINGSAPGAGSTTTDKTSGSATSDIIGGLSAIAGTPSGDGGTLGGDLFSSFARGGSVHNRGDSNVSNIVAAIRSLPPHTLANLAARMHGHPLLYAAMTRRGFADGGAPDFAAPYLPTAPVIAAPAIVPAQSPSSGGSSSSSSGSSMASLASLASMAMMFMNSGGAVRKGFADGGMPYSDSPSLADLMGSDGNMPAVLGQSIVPASAAIAPPSTASAPSLASLSAANSNAAPTPSLASTGTDGGSPSWADQASRSPLMAFGLGTLAGSNDPNASAIGRGGLAALQAVEGHRKSDMDLALEREQLRGAGTENSLKDLQLKAYQDLAGSNPSPAGASPTDITGHVQRLMADASGPTPSGGASASGTATAAPQGVGSPSQPPPLFNASSLVRQYNIASRTPGMEGLATQLLEAINKGVPEGSYLGTDGGIYARPGYLSGVSAKAAAEAGAKAAETPHFTPTKDAFGNTLSFDTRNGQATPVNGGGQGEAVQDWAVKAQALENGTGNPGAKNPNSTATGNGQFINSTWLTDIKAAHPDLAKTMSDPQLLALRNDSGIANEMTIYSAKQNASALTASGIPVNSSTLLLAHRFGADGAKTILAAPDTATMGSVLPASVIKANPTIANTPVSVYKAGIAAKMGTAPVDVSGTPSSNNDAENPIINSWVANVTAGNATMSQVPAPLRNRVSMALQATPTSSYSPLASRRLTMAADAIATPYKNLPQYSLTANGLPYLQRIDAALKTPGSVSDQDLLDSLTKLNTAGNAVSDAQVKIITDGKSYSDWLGTIANKFQNGGVLSNNQRKQIRDIANNVYANYRSGYQPVYDRAVAQLKAAGIPEQFWTIPDLNKLNGGQARVGAPQPGFISKGHRFKGGDPASPTSWEAVQ